MDATSKARRCGEGLSQLKQEFAQWRAVRKVGERIPVPLWTVASEATLKHGAYHVAVELHLDYAKLKRRAARAAGAASAAIFRVIRTRQGGASDANDATGASVAPAVRDRNGQRARRVDARGAQRLRSGGPVERVQCI